MTKQIVTLTVGDYPTEITKLTFPQIKRYANKIGADFNVITERKFPNVPIMNYEKFQLYELAQDYDYTLFIDADAAIFPDMPDVFALSGPHMVVFWGFDFSPERFRPTLNTERDRRWQGAGTWFVGCTRSTYELWTPPEDWKEAVNNIFPVNIEAKIDASHLIDDYQLTQNIARFGLNAWTFMQFIKETNRPNTWACHNHLMTTDEKIAYLTKELGDRGLIK